MYKRQVLGGTSGERAVSLDSGRACIKALKKKGYKVSTFDPKKKPLKRNLGVEKIIQTKDQIVYLMHTTQEHEMNFLYKSLLKAEKESEAISRMFSKSSLS